MSSVTADIKRIDVFGHHPAIMGWNYASSVTAFAMLFTVWVIVKGYLHIMKLWPVYRQTLSFWVTSGVGMLVFLALTAITFGFERVVLQRMEQTTGRGFPRFSMRHTVNVVPFFVVFFVWFAGIVITSEAIWMVGYNPANLSTLTIADLGATGLETWNNINMLQLMGGIIVFLCGINALMANNRIESAVQYNVEKKG